MLNENGIIKKAFSYLVVYSFPVFLIFGGLWYMDSRRAVEPVNSEYIEYLELQSERLGDIEQSLGELSELGDEIRAIGEISKELNAFNRESKDSNLGVGILSDQNQRIISELRSRSNESEIQK